MLGVKPHLPKVSATIILIGEINHQLREVISNSEDERARNRMPHGKTGVNCTQTE